MLNVALLGFGRIGQMHANNINKHKDLKLLYVYEKIIKLSSTELKKNIWKTKVEFLILIWQDV